MVCSINSPKTASYFIERWDELNRGNFATKQ